MSTRITSLFLILVCLALPPARAITLEECQNLAQENYPLLKQYDVLDNVTEYTVDNIAKGWLPQISASAQATLQNRVAALPEQLTTILTEMGGNLKGLSKAQYRIGLDVNQTVWEGGAIKNAQNVARLQNEVQRAQTDVDMYGIRERVNEVYFGMLLIEERINLNKTLISTLSANKEKLERMQKGGTASGADVASVEAEVLKAEQQNTQLQTMRSGYMKVLSLLIGKDETEIGNLEKPAERMVSHEVNRPELSLLDKRLQLTDAQEKSLKSGLMPRISLFAQGYYGYTGYDMFHDMYHRAPTVNGLIGARITWNISNLYTNKNDRAKLALERKSIENQREVFLFNNNLKTRQENEIITGQRKMLADDDRIISLRETVRKAAESKLQHGIIDTSNLIREINNENEARISKSAHEIELLKQIYRILLVVLLFNKRQSPRISFSQRAQGSGKTCLDRVIMENSL